jgi:hypothetical protein
MFQLTGLPDFTVLKWLFFSYVDLKWCRNELFYYMLNNSNMISKKQQISV